MDKYAGGISMHYRYSDKSLKTANEKIIELEEKAKTLSARDMQELVYVFELLERLTVCKSVIAHLAARKETRWNSFAEHTDYPTKSNEWVKYINSRLENGEIRIIYRSIVEEGNIYEH